VASHSLYLTNTRLVSLLARAGQASVRREFEASEAGAAQFDAYLATVSDVPIHFFTDLAEEDFRPDTIPHVGARDREAIVTRKLGQIFRNTPYRYAVLQGRDTDGRRDDRVVYAAITNPDVVKPWLDIIEARAAPLAGMYSAAILGTRVIEALELAHVLQGDPVVGLDQPLADEDAEERSASDDWRLGVVRSEAQHFIDAGRQVPGHDVLLLRAVLLLQVGRR